MAAHWETCMKLHDVIFLSASLPYRPPWAMEAQPTEIEQAIVSTARAVFARQGRLLFGGHPSISWTRTVFRPVDVASCELSHSCLTVVEHNNDPSQ